MEERVKLHEWDEHRWGPSAAFGANCAPNSAQDDNLISTIHQTLHLVGALVCAGEAVVPGEAVFVERGPQEAEAKRAYGDQDGQDAAAHGVAGRILVVEGAEGDAGAAHPWGGFGEREEERVVEEIEEGEDEGAGCQGETGLESGVGDDLGSGVGREASQG